MNSYDHEESIPSPYHPGHTLFVLSCRLKKAYLLLDSLHGPKETDLDMLQELSQTGLPHQLILTKLDRAPATVWSSLSTTLKHNPTKDAVFKSAARTLHGQRPQQDLEELKMGVWRPLRGALGLGCDETILGVSSEEGWGISGLRCSILKACGALGSGNFGDEEYLRALQEAPIIQERRDVESQEVVEEDEEEWEGEENWEGREKEPRRVTGDLESKFEDDNPMRGKVFGGKEMLRKKIYRW